MRRIGLIRVAGQVARALGSDECLLVGGLAVGAHGYVRATRDVDFMTRRPLSEARGRLRESGIAAALKRGDVLVGDFPCLKGEIDGVRIHVMPPLVPLHWERGIELVVGRNTRIRVVDLEGLLHLKLRAGGPKDLMDAAALLLRHAEHLGKARELAVAYQVTDALEGWLCDPRLRAEVDETAAAEGSKRRRQRPRSS